MGVNRDRNAPDICSDPKAQAAVHAEVSTLRLLRGVDLSRATLVSARVMSDGSAGLAKPCNRCWGAIDISNVGRVLWTTNTDEIGEW